MLDRLRAVRVCDDLRRRRAIGVLAAWNRRARLNGIRGNVPLGDARGQLDVVVLSAGAVPLSDPARWQARGRKCRPLSAWSRRTRHIRGRWEEKLSFSLPLLYREQKWAVREETVRSGRPFAGEGGMIDAKACEKQGPP